MNCPVCKSENCNNRDIEFIHDDFNYHIKECEECECLFYVNEFTFDFESNFEHNRNLKVYLEKTADIDAQISIVDNIFSSLPPGYNVGFEVGCGAGLVLDFLENHLGKSVQGFEPSLHYVQEAKEFLGLEINQNFFSKDVVNSSNNNFALCF